MFSITCLFFFFFFFLFHMVRLFFYVYQYSILAPECEHWNLLHIFIEYEFVGMHFYAWFLTYFLHAPNWSPHHPQLVTPWQAHDRLQPLSNTIPILYSLGGHLSYIFARIRESPIVSLSHTEMAFHLGGPHAWLGIKFANSDYHLHRFRPWKMALFLEVWVVTLGMKEKRK